MDDDTYQVLIVFCLFLVSALSQASSSYNGTIFFFCDYRRQSFRKENAMPRRIILWKVFILLSVEIIEVQFYDVSIVQKRRLRDHSKWHLPLIIYCVYDVPTVCTSLDIEDKKQHNDFIHKKSMSKYNSYQGSPYSVILFNVPLFNYFIIRVCRTIWYTCKRYSSLLRPPTTYTFLFCNEYLYTQ